MSRVGRYVVLWRRLDELILQDRDDGAAADALRSQMDRLWVELTPTDVREIDQIVLPIAMISNELCGVCDELRQLGAGWWIVASASWPMAERLRRLRGVVELRRAGLARDAVGPPPPGAPAPPARGGAPGRRCILLCGGMDRLSAAYGVEAAALGIDLLLHWKVVRRGDMTAPAAAGVVIICEKTSHALRSQGEAVARRGAVPIVYARGPAVVCVRAAMVALLLVMDAK